MIKFQGGLSFDVKIVINYKTTHEYKQIFAVKQALARYNYSILILKLCQESN